ncbi:MAG: serine hydrolase domain-containing protein [Ilumatobacteraceae bacterium]
MTPLTPVRRIACTLGALCVALAACAGGDDAVDTVADSVARDSTSTGLATTGSSEGTVAMTVVETPAVTFPAITSPAITSPAVTSPETTPPTTAPLTASTTAPAVEASYDFTAVGPIVDSFVTERGLDGAGLVIVERDRGIVHEQYWGEFAADRVSLIASSSKMLTAGVLLRLADQGLLDLDAPVADVVDWGAGNPDVTPAQLVSNSSGLVGLLDDVGYGPYLCQFLAAGTLQACAERVFTTPDDDADVSPSDTRFRYGGAQWQVAGAVAEVAAGTSWAELIDETYVRPCGVDSLGYNNHFAQLPGRGFAYPDGFDDGPSVLSATDNPNMEGGAFIDPPDYAALLLMHLRDGRCGDVQVLSEAAVERMHEDRIGEVYGGSTYTGSGYGMGWWVDDTRITDPGAYGSVPWLDLDGGYGAYLVIEADAATGNELASKLFGPVDTAFARAG